MRNMKALALSIQKLWPKLMILQTKRQVDRPETIYALEYGGIKLSLSQTFDVNITLFAIKHMNATFTA